MTFEAIIGLEIHIEMQTNSKMFSSSPVSYGQEPNTNVSIFDMAFPGSMPLPNKCAVINAIRTANALNMDISHTLTFERKNYFYSDLPKGYQITQKFNPLGRNGYLDLDTDGVIKRINIEELHIEEDTCKQIHYVNYSLLDFNRAGVPLIEIVTKPEIKSGKEAADFVKKIRSIVTFLGVSDGKMEDGSMRCDVNISLRTNENDFGTKVEIKNLNSINNIQHAIDYEIYNQSLILERGEKVVQETKRFDENLKQTVLMRVKNDAVDYKFFTDSNILPFILTSEFVKEAIETSPELADVKAKRYLALGVDEKNANKIIQDANLANYFDKLLINGASPTIAANWLNDEIRSFINKNNIDIISFPISPENLAKLLNLIKENQISNSQAREIFTKLVKSDEEINKLLGELSFHQVNDEGEIRPIINKILDQNPKAIDDYKNGKDKALGYLVGLILKATDGKANPTLSKELLLEEIKRR